MSALDLGLRIAMTPDYNRRGQETHYTIVADHAGRVAFIAGVAPPDYTVGNLYLIEDRFTLDAASGWSRINPALYMNLDAALSTEVKMFLIPTTEELVTGVDFEPTQHYLRLAVIHDALKVVDAYYAEQMTLMRKWLERRFKLGVLIA